MKSSAISVGQTQLKSEPAETSLASNMETNSGGRPMETKAASSSAAAATGSMEPIGELSRDGIEEISAALRHLLADVFALYVKTKNFHWHMSGEHFRDYHLLLDEHAEQIFAMTDDIAERARKIGGATLHSISDIAKHQRLKDDNRESVSAHDMLAELETDNRELTRFLRIAHEKCDKYGDVATASMIEVWIDQAERRTWFLTQIVGRR
jgi:starvation-inducible DNA-binding protein